MDQEMIAYFDEHFRATARQIEGLREEMIGRFEQVDRRFERVDGRFEQMDRRFEQVDGRFEQVDRRFEQVDRRFEQVDGRFEQVDGRFEQVDGRFEQVDGRFERGEEALRHTQVSVEGLRGEIRLVAEGVAHTNERLDSLKTEVAQEFSETRKMIRLGYSDLDRRVRALEARRERPDRDPTEPL